jgi:hypothetical protein
MTGQAGNSGQDRGGAVDDERREPPGGQRDLTDDIQRWLVRSGVRSMRRELNDQVRRAFHGRRPAEPADVWDAATTEPPPDLLAPAEAPECAWCPVCRAARRIRESGPGLSGPLSSAGDAVAAAVQEALSAFDTLLSARPQRGSGSGFPADRYPAGRFPADRFPDAGTPARDAGHAGHPGHAGHAGTPAREAGHAGHAGTPPREAEHEPDDRD